LKNNFEKDCLKRKRSYLCSPLDCKRGIKFKTEGFEQRLKKKQEWIRDEKRPAILKEAKADLEQVL
jgi:hypothetical protein